MAVSTQNSTTSPPAGDSARNRSELATLPLAWIERWEEQPRKKFDEDALDELAGSIQEHGLIEPLVVRPVGPGRYRLIAGERRWRACQMNGLEEVPVQIRHDVDDATAMKLALIENLHREDLDPIEEAEGYAALNRIVGMKQADIAAAVKRSQPVIANAIRLLELPEPVQQMVRDGRLSKAHGLALLKYADKPAFCAGLAAHVIANMIPSKVVEAGITDPWGNKGGIAASQLGEHLVTRVDDSDLETTDLEAAGITVFGEGYHRYTPDIETYAAAASAARKAKEARIQRQLEEARAAAKAEGKKLVKLDGLPYGSYEEIRSWSRPPEGCSEACPCRARAIARGSKEVVQICTDPKRYQKLSTAKAREETKERRTAAKEKAAELDAILAAAPALDVHGLAIVVANRLWQYPKAVGRRMIQQFAAEVLDPKVLESYDTRRDTYEKLARLPAENLVRILVHGSLLDEVSRYHQYGTMSSELTWYLEGAGIETVPTDEASLRGLIQVAQARVNDIHIQNQPGLCERWKDTLRQLDERLVRAVEEKAAVHAAAVAAGVLEEDPPAPPKPRTNPTVCQGCGHVRGKCTCAEASTEGLRANSRAYLMGLLTQYGVFSPSDQPADDAVLIEFARDLLCEEEMPDVRDHDRAIVRDAIADLEAQLTTSAPAEAAE
jgi:ParB/RepB/Spo0J family partition protein